MTFEIRKLSEIPRHHLNFNGLKISDDRMPRAREQDWVPCAYDEERGILFFRLKTTIWEDRDAFQGFSVLVFGQDPIVFTEWNPAWMSETFVTRKYPTSRIVETIREIERVWQPRWGRFNLKAEGEPNRHEKGVLNHRKFVEGLSKNHLRRRTHRRMWLYRTFPFLRPPAPPARNIFEFMDRYRIDSDAMGYEQTSQLQIKVIANDDIFSIVFTNVGRSDLRDISISQKEMLSLLMPGFQEIIGFRKINFDFTDMPTADAFDDSVNIANLRAQSSTTISWPRFGIYEPHSKSVLVSFSTVFRREQNYLAFAVVVD
ncbi:hypothetical protein [Thiosocius teredinicola]|uniref:hypothetical protein n=1 Tax=Thiosocius teredinicola TaxID=1973002 RepID=UPI000F794209